MPPAPDTHHPANGAPPVGTPGSVASSHDAVRYWVQQHPAESDPVRREAFQVGCSAILHRHAKFGDEGFLDLFQARELVEAHRFLSSDPQQTLARTAYGRALVEDDATVIDALVGCGAALDYHAWAERLRRADAATCSSLLAMMTDPEERGVGRLLVGRRFPELIASTWVTDACAGDERIAYATCLLACQQRKDLAAAVAAALRRAPWILLRGGADRLLAALVTAHAQAPQQVLAAFTGYYDEETLVAAAAWHLEHGQAAEALELAERVRWLGVQGERAALVAGCALAEAGRADEALARIADCADSATNDTVRLRVAELRGADEDLDWLTSRLTECTAVDAELFFRGVKKLLQSRRLAAARELCAAGSGVFADHPAVQPVIAAVLAVGR